MLLIPRIFHRIWLGRSPMPRDFVEFGEQWLALHPGWKLHTWTDSSIRHLAQTQAFKKAAAQSGRANVLRYAILLHYGGVYVDTDFECKKNLEPLLQHVSCFVAQQARGLANNAVMGATPNHPFLRSLVAGLERPCDAYARQLTIKQSGPYYLNSLLAGRRDVTVYPPELFYPYQWHERWRRREHFPLAYGVHHWSLSWRARCGSRRCSLPPRLTVVVISVDADAERLEWVLEGLCRQSGATAFDVRVMQGGSSPAIGRVVDRFGTRLSVTLETIGREQRGLFSEAVRRSAAGCAGGRVLLLDARCVPAPDVIAGHARFDVQSVVAYSEERIYPRGKFYSFLQPLDYDALEIHSVAGRGASDRTAGLGTIPESGISFARLALAETRVPRTLEFRAGGRWLACDLARRGHEVVALKGRAGLFRLA